MGVKYVNVLATLGCVGLLASVALSSVVIGEKWSKLWVLFGDLFDVRLVPLWVLSGCAGVLVIVDTFGVFWGILSGCVGVLLGADFA